MKQSTLILASALLATTSVFAAEEPSMTVPGTLGIQLKPDCSDDANVKAVADLGAKFVRRGFYWNGVETEKGVYNFDVYDKFLERTDKQRLRVIGCLFGGNKLYEDTGFGGVTTEEGRKGFAAFAAAVAERYKDRNIIWEIWNEPNVRTFWRKNGVHNTPEFAQEYTALVKATAPAIMKADSKAIVLAGSLSNYWQPSYSWTSNCFELGILKSGIKGWSVHPYGVSMPELHAEGHGIMRKLMKRYGAENFPMYNTERGYGTKLKKGHEGEIKGKAELAKEYQAWFFVRQYMIDLLWDVKLSLWYEWRDKSGEFAMFDGATPRPVHKAAEEMVKQLRGYTFVRRLKTEAPLDYVLLFYNQFKDPMLVCWTTPAAKQPIESTVKHTIEIPFSEPFVGCDIYGQTIQLARNGDKSLVELTGSPVYLKSKLRRR